MRDEVVQARLPEGQRRTVLRILIRRAVGIQQAQQRSERVSDGGRVRELERRIPVSDVIERGRIYIVTQPDKYAAAECIGRIRVAEARYVVVDPMEVDPARNRVTAFDPV